VLALLVLVRALATSLSSLAPSSKLINQINRNDGSKRTNNCVSWLCQARAS